MSWMKTEAVIVGAYNGLDRRIMFDSVLVLLLPEQSKSLEELLTLCHTSAPYFLELCILLVQQCIEFVGEILNVGTFQGHIIVAL